MIKQFIQTNYWFKADKAIMFRIHVFQTFTISFLHVFVDEILIIFCDSPVDVLFSPKFKKKCFPM